MKRFTETINSGSTNNHYFEFDIEVKFNYTFFYKAIIFFLLLIGIRNKYSISCWRSISRSMNFRLDFRFNWTAKTADFEKYQLIQNIRYGNLKRFKWTISIKVSWFSIDSVKHYSVTAYSNRQASDDVTMRVFRSKSWLARHHSWLSPM